MKNNEKLGIFVLVKNDNFDKAMKIFKKKVKDSGIMLELKNREFYEKPSTKKRQSMKKSKLRQQQINKTNNI